MDVNLQRKPAKSQNLLANSKYELPFELDSTMPDYCRDIKKILNTNISPVICSVICNDSKLIIDGNILICVYYLDNEDNISKYESKTPFNKAIDIKHVPQNISVNSKVYEGYFNCRAVSPRRLDLRGAIVIEIDACSYDNYSLIENIIGDDIEVNKKTFEFADFIGQWSKQFTIKEDFEINDKNCKPSYLIRYNICPLTKEYKILPDKIIIKGFLNITICYCSENNKQFVRKEFKIPFSQIIDCPNLDEDCICECQLKLINSEITYSSKEKDSFEFNISATICANIVGYKKVIITSISDCFCHSCECTCKTKKLNMNKIISVINDTFTHTENINVNDFTEIKDCWCKPIFTEYEYDNKNLIVKIKAVICILGIKDNLYCCIEKPVIITLDVLKNQIIQCPYFNNNISIIDCKFTDINNSKIDIICNIKVSGIVFDKIVINAVDGLKPNENAKKQINQDLVFIHYVNTKESLWDIAKKYNNKVDYIKELNNIKKDYSDIGQTLIITPYKNPTPLKE